MRRRRRGGRRHGDDVDHTDNDVDHTGSDVDHTGSDVDHTGNDIDYEGVTGSGTYTDGGVNDVARAYTPFNTDGTVGDPVPLDGDRALEIIEQIAVQAECDADNSCEW